MIGLTTGITGISSPRFVEEYTPVQIYGPLSVLAGFSVSITLAGSLMLSSLGIPHYTEDPTIFTTHIVQYIKVEPYIFCFVGFVIIKFFIKHEPPKFLITKGDLDGALLSIKDCYHSSEDPEEVLEYLQKNISEETDKITYRQALCDSQYCIPTYVIIFLGILTSFNGNNFIQT